jgi:phage baseplate assembly protein W
MTLQIDYPYHVAGDGRTATTTTEDEHIRDLIEEVLFTMPGERVNRPTFGSDLSRMVFAPNSAAAVPALQLAIQGSLLQWLGELIIVDAVEVVSVDSTLTVTVRYLVRRNQQRQIVELTRGA